MKENRTLRTRSVLSQKEKYYNKSIILKKSESNSQTKLDYKLKGKINYRSDYLKTEFHESNNKPFVNKSYQMKDQTNQQSQPMYFKNNYLQSEKLHQQNISLKKKINKLNQDLTIQKCKNLFQLKQKAKNIKQVNLQIDYDLYSNAKTKTNNFKNQIVYNPNAHMISGIKQRYDLLKQQYDEKSKQLQTFLKKVQLTSIFQLQKYICVLEQQNKKLIESIENFKTKREFLYNNCKYFQSNKKRKKQDNSIEEFQILQNLKSQIDEVCLQNSNLLLQIQIFKERVHHYELQNRDLNKKYNQKKIDCENLSRVITLKDNQIYQINKLVKRMKKEKKNSYEKTKQIQQEIQQLKSSCNLQIQSINYKSKKMFQIQKKIFQTQLAKKDEKISKLQKEISYLSTLLKYWKPLDQIDQVEKDSKLLSPQKSQAVPSQQSNKLNNSNLNISNMIGSIRKRAKTKMSAGERNIVDFKLNLQQQNFPKGVSQKGSEQSFDDNQIYQNIVLREPKTSRKKHSQQGKKVRKVSPNQIQYLKQQLFYRLIGYEIQMKDVKKLFDYSQQKIKGSLQEQKSQFSQQDEEKLFAKHYIKMSEIKLILKKFPFYLSQKQAQLLARYIVQDSTAQHVYRDQLNQISRNIAKSIIFSFIGMYELTDNDKAKQQWKKILQIYQVNLKLALSSLAPDGKISYEKLFDLFESIQIQASQNLKNFIISRLFILSQENSKKPSLSELKYAHLFQKKFLQNSSK